MDFIRFHGLVHLQVLYMVSNLIFSYCGWFFFLPVPAFVCGSGAVVGALTDEDQSKKAIEYLRLLHAPGNQLSHFLSDSSQTFSPLFLLSPTYREKIFLLL